MLNDSLQGKYDALKQLLSDYGSVAVAFSAGVDSTLLLAVAHEVLGERAVAVTALSLANPAREAGAASSFCAQHGIRQVTFEADELQIDGFDRNPPERCYLCKRHLFGQIVRLSEELGLSRVVEGSNTDDLDDYRPGNRALKELGTSSPLLEAGFSKQDVRDLSEHLGLPTWNKPSFACLYTRISFGDLITREKVERIDKAEQWLIDRGFATVRVRLANAQGDAARIEVALPDLGRLCEEPLRAELVDAFERLGFASIAVDLRGYRTGSMNPTQ